MLLKKADFCKDDEFDYWEDVSGALNNCICARELRRLFNVPESAKELTIYLHDKPSKWRMPARIGECDNGFGWYDMIFDQARAYYAEYGDITLDELLKKYVGKTLHVEVWYS